MKPAVGKCAARIRTPESAWTSTNARRAQVVEVRAPAHVPGGRVVARLVVADARVDQHGVAGRPHDVGADARAEVAGPVVPEVRPEPVVVARDHVWRCVREHGQGRERRAVELDDAADGDVAKRERAHANRGITFSPNRRMDLTIRSWGTPPRLNDPMRYVRPRAS